MAAPGPNTPQHKRLVELVRSRREYARRFFCARFDRWRESEKSFRGYVEPTTAKDPNVPWLRKLFVPVTPLLVQTQLSFDVAAWTQGTPMIRLDGVGPEDIKAVKPLEAYLEWEARTRGALREIFGWLLDRRRYGMGVMWNRWAMDYGYRTVTETRTHTVPLLGTQITTKVKNREQYVKFEGNDFQVEDPFNFGFDPRVSAARLQEGEFVYRLRRRPYSYMQENSKGEDPLYTNVDEIPRLSQSHTLQTPGTTGGAFVDRMDTDGDSDRNKIVNLTQDRTLGRETVDPNEKGYVDLTEMIVRLVPRDYQIGPESDPCLYWVTLANDVVVVRAEPYDYNHQQFPCVVIESNPDPHSVLNISSVEELAELQKFANWLYRSHAEHVIRTLNGQFLVDPSKIHIEDLLTPQPGNLVRIKPDAFAIPGGLRDAFQQLQVTDVTKGHIGEIQSILGFLERLSAANENLQGAVNSGDTTLGEQKLAFGSSVGRLKTSIQLAWNQGMIPLTKQRIANVQQFLEDERFVRIVGGIQDDLQLPPEKRFVRLSPDDITGDLDVMPIDGIVRGDGQLLQAWTQVFTTIMNSPEVSARYDMNGMLRFIAMLSGVRNLQDFELKPAAMPVPPIPGAPPSPVQPIDAETLAKHVQAGNLAPAPEVFGGR